MVGINDLLLGALIVITGSTLIKKVSSLPSKEGLPITQKFYNARQAINFEVIQDITQAQDRLQNIRSQTLQQEQFKTEAQVGILQAEKSKAGVLISQLQKIVEQGWRESTYSPRLRRKFGNLTPQVEATIQRGKQAQQVIPQITNIVQQLDQNILKLNKSYSSLESI